MLKKAAVFGLAFGCAFAITATSAVVAVKWYSSRPKSWDAKSITCVSATAVTTYHYTPETRDFKIAGFSFKFALANNTSRDYTVPQNVKLLRRDTGSKALADFAGKLDHAVLIPAGERAELTIHTEYSCADIDAAGNETERDESTFFKDALGDAVEFVALDDDNKIRLNLLKPALASPKKENGPGKHVDSQPSRLLLPSKGGIFDRIASCEEADRLVSLCKKQNFRPPKAPSPLTVGMRITCAICRNRRRAIN